MGCVTANPSRPALPTRERTGCLWSESLWICLCLAGVILAPETIPAALAVGTTSSLDAGGKRVTSASYIIDGSIGSLGGISAAASPPVIARDGYAGQLYDLQSILLSASPTNVNETGTSQMAAIGVLDDATILSISASNVAWRVVSGPIVFINASGLAITTNVYQNTGATVSAVYQSSSATLMINVINTGNDDFGIYAHDGMDDAWQVRYFGLNNTNAGPNGDPDGDGASNHDEYIADTNPTNALSHFQVLSLSKTAGFAVYSQTLTNQNCTLFYASNLTAGGWNPVPSQIGIRGTVGLQGLADVSPLASRRFYRVASRITNLRIEGITNFGGWSASFVSSSNRIYSLHYSTNLISGAWTNIPSQTDIPGSGGVVSLTDPSSKGAQRYYRIGVRVP